jgi:serine/threonine protein kinase
LLQHVTGGFAEQVPTSPELCGLQAILPRRCGLTVKAKLGEGSFGKVVMAVNNSNHSGTGQGQLGKTTRIIHKLPKTGVQVVLKCIKKAKYDGCVLNESECLAREVLIHGQVVHHINSPLAADILYWLLTYLLLT